MKNNEIFKGFKGEIKFKGFSRASRVGWSPP